MKYQSDSYYFSREVWNSPQLSARVAMDITRLKLAPAHQSQEIIDALPPGAAEWLCENIDVRRATDGEVDYSLTLPRENDQGPITDTVQLTLSGVATWWAILSRPHQPWLFALTGAAQEAQRKMLCGVHLVLARKLARAEGLALAARPTRYDWQDDTDDGHRPSHTPLDAATLDAATLDAAIAGQDSPPKDPDIDPGRCPKY